MEGWHAVPGWLKNSLLFIQIMRSLTTSRLRRTPPTEENSHPFVIPAQTGTGFITVRNAHNLGSGGQHRHDKCDKLFTSLNLYLSWSLILF